MQCPLCAGPLRLAADTEFACERGHEMGPEELAAAAASRVTTAFWMAIEALESEAAGLRTLAASGYGNHLVGLAQRADEDARILRDVADAHEQIRQAGPGHDAAVMPQNGQDLP
ncbi:MAG: hypothetical protein AB1679_01645 [Actinomycetota bacterium]